LLLQPFEGVATAESGGTHDFALVFVKAVQHLPLFAHLQVPPYVAFSQRLPELGQLQGVFQYLIHFGLKLYPDSKVTSSLVEFHLAARRGPAHRIPARFMSA
jgi:hypothetical protein